MLLPTLVLLVASASARGQWMTQNIPLSPGWNAMFLEVHPEQEACDMALKGLPIESVWMWNPQTSTVQFIDDVNTLLDEGRESWTVLRQVQFEFTAADPEYPEDAQAGWGDTQIGGVYSEILSGLHKDPIKTQGVFRLQRVSNVPELDPEI